LDQILNSLEDNGVIDAPSQRECALESVALYLEIRRVVRQGSCNSNNTGEKVRKAVTSFRGLRTTLSYSGKKEAVTSFEDYFFLLRKEAVEK
jgi:hypothetical protein